MSLALLYASPPLPTPASISMVLGSLNALSARRLVRKRACVTASGGKGVEVEEGVTGVEPCEGVGVSESVHTPMYLHTLYRSVRLVCVLSRSTYLCV